MSNADRVQRHLEQEEDRIQRAFDSGQLSEAEYQYELRELQRDARQAYEDELQEAQQRVRDEWGGW